MSVLYILVGLLLLVGLAGSFLPFVPGTPLILAGALLYALATDFSSVGPGRLLALAGLCALGYLLDYAASALGTKKLGGSGWGVFGAVLGGLVGVFFGPFGLVLGPVLGAVGAELARGREWRGSLKSGLGALAGILAGAVAKFALALIMVALFVWWVWTG